MTVTIEIGPVLADTIRQVAGFLLLALISVAMSRMWGQRIERNERAERSDK